MPRGPDQSGLVGDRAYALIDTETGKVVSAKNPRLWPDLFACRTAFSEPNHPAVAADLLEPFVREEVAWMVRVHQDFQGRHYYGYLGKDPDARRAHRGHPGYELAARFADEWDQTSFDPEYPTMPLEHFEPLVRETFAAPQHI